MATQVSRSSKSLVALFTDECFDALMNGLCVLVEGALFGKALSTFLANKILSPFMHGRDVLTKSGRTLRDVSARLARTPRNSFRAPWHSRVC